MLSKIKRLNAYVVTYFLLSTFLGLFAWPYLLYLGHGLHWVELAVFIFMMAFGYFGINLGYHRGFSHLSFKMSKPVRWLALIAGASTGEGPALFWCSDHRRHHVYEDTDLDPYGIQKGFWNAHIGWMLVTRKGDFTNCTDLARFPSVRWQRKFYIPIFLISALALPYCLGAIWGRGLEALCLGGFTRLLVFNHVTFAINSFAHTFGRKTYSLKKTARDSHIVAIFTGGEGYHSYHHRYPFDFRNGHKFFHFDVTKWMILSLAKLRLVYDLKKRVS